MCPQGAGGFTQKTTSSCVVFTQKEGHPYYASARLWDDGVIHPAETRAILMQALQAVNSKPIEETKFPVFRM